MTTIKNHKEIEINGVLYFVEQYQEKDASVYLWRYGYYVTTFILPYRVELKSGLLSRPNIKKLFA